MENNLLAKNLDCNYNDETRNYPDDYTGLFWLDSKDPYDQYGKKGLVNFDVNKKTVIFIHGWSEGIIRNKEFNCLSSTTKNQYICHNSWLKEWNVGIFRWEAFADDDEPFSDMFNHFTYAPIIVESKIHTSHNQFGFNNMRYKNNHDDNFSYLTPESPFYNCKTISDIFVYEYGKIFSLANTLEMRFVGHSLGCQLSLSVVKKINVDNLLYKSVDRLELLDPYFCYGKKKYLNNKTSGEIAIKNLKSFNPPSNSFFKQQVINVAVSWIQCTNLTDITYISDSNVEMKKYLVWQGVKFWYLSDISLADRHNEIIQWYFSTYNKASMKVYKYKSQWFRLPVWNIVTNPQNCIAISATNDIEYIKTNMLKAQYFLHIHKSIFMTDADKALTDGVLTIDTSDDIFSIETGFCPDNEKLYEYFRATIL